MVAIDSKLLDQIILHATENGVHEVCGILAGKGSRALKLYRMANTSDTPEHCYFMDPKEQLQVMKQIRNEGLELVGIYHSHPGSEAYPSQRDVELAFYPEAAYIIISLQNKSLPEIKAFKIVDGKIVEEELMAL